MYVFKRSIAILSVLILGFTSQAFTQSNDDWKFDFGLYSRVISASGTTLGKDEASGFPTAVHVRFRPTFTASKDGFSATFGTGSDIFWGSGQGSFYPPGSGQGDMLAIRNMNLKYKAQNGFYLQGGIILTDIPMFLSDGLGSFVLGWSNDMIDARAFYGQINTGTLFNPKDDGGVMGVLVDVAATDSFSITPFVLGVYQRSGASNPENVLDPGSYGGYAGGAMFVGGFGILPGLTLSYNSSMGFFLDASILGAFGNNNPTIEDETAPIKLKQKRKAVGSYIEAGYKLESLFKASIFFDFRSGDDNAYANGTNSSFNGAVLEYDASHVAPLLILYNDGLGKYVVSYGQHSDDGYAFSDRGAVTIGASLDMKISDFSIGTNFGYGMYAAGKGSNSMGFEIDVIGGYQIMENLKTVLQFGVLIPGKGLKNLVTGATRTPLLLNIGLVYS